MQETETAAPETVYPTIHLNGSNAQVLLDELCDAAGRVRKARYGLAATAPHGRDYYLQGPDALAKAVAAHSRRCDALEAITKELMVLAHHVHNQIIERNGGNTPARRTVAE